MFVANLASGLVPKLVSLATEEVIRAWNLQDDLENLRKRLESIDALLSDANTRNLTMPAVQNWFNKLEALANVTEVFMDELAYEITRQKVETHHMVWDFFIPSKNKMVCRFKVAHKIKSIHASFDIIFQLARDLGLEPIAHLSSIVQPREIRNTPPFEDESQIVGRDYDISYLVQTVCKNHAHKIKVIAVVGMGGQGKTTLARMVYNKDVVINMFSKRMWVTVSDDFDFMKIMNQMVVSLTSTPSTLENTEGLINYLQKKLKGEKFLLVLDDVWNEKQEEWDNLMNSLIGVGGAIGSNILVTTRKQEVIDVMRCSVCYSMEKLSEEYSWALFRQRAFTHGGVLETEIFKTLGRRMVQRCGGLPLAIKTLGGLLHSKKSEQEWLLIDTSEIWKSKGVLSSLMLSYDNLPYSSLKRCFTYFSIMPKGSNIYKDEVVQIWMALGFLLPPIGSNALMEDIGNEYFNILLWNSLLQEVERDASGNIKHCKMHDLVHDLALDLSKHHSVTLKVGQQSNHISQAIYVRLDEGVSDIKPPINFERVQILFAGAHIFADVLPCLKCLTVLVLNADKVTNELPSSLRRMKYLKHLDISRCRYRLPSCITELYNLQTLRVWDLDELPKKFCNLINLRHLLIENASPKTRCMFNGIGRFICLQTLPHFVVSRDEKCLIRQLGGLKNLRGKLELYGLGDIENMEEASKASLCTKPNIERLKLVWRNKEDVMEKIEYNDTDVMEGLKPHANILELTIINFMGRKFASWITMMTNLVKVTLRNCKRCEVFPQLGHLPKLREMDINGMDALRVIGSHFYGGLGSDEISGSCATMYPSLTRLILWGLPKLEEWVEPAMRQIFPKLEVLVIVSCSKLTRIPKSCFMSLKELEIENLDSTLILETMSRKVSSLTNLRLTNISDGDRGCSSSPNIDLILKELLETSSKTLTNLKLDHCQGLTRVNLNLCVALETLKVVDCPNLLRIIATRDLGTVTNHISRCPNLKEGRWKEGRWIGSNHTTFMDYDLDDMIPRGGTTI